MERTGETRTQGAPRAGATAHRATGAWHPDVDASGHDAVAGRSGTSGTDEASSDAAAARPWGALRHDVERAIRSVPGVIEASVGVSAETGRGRLRIRLSPGEDHDAVCWSVATTLRERFGIALDPAAIRPRVDAGPDDAGPSGATPGMPSATGPRPVESPRVVEDLERVTPEQRQVFEELEEAVAARLAAEAPTARSGPPVGVAAGGERLRAAIGNLVTEQGPAAVSVTATLSHGGRQGRAAVGALATRRATWRAVAEATLGALQDLTGGRLRAQVERVTVNATEDPATVSVVLAVLGERGEEMLLGAALVRDDPERAVMRATLDAVNRRVEPWLRDLAAG